MIYLDGGSIRLSCRRCMTRWKATGAGSGGTHQYFRHHVYHKALEAELADLQMPKKKKERGGAPPPGPWGEKIPLLKNPLAYIANDAPIHVARSCFRGW